MRSISVLILALLLPLALLPASAASEGLPDRWQHWLADDVRMVIADEERAVFIGLATDPERERFVERFWLARDPTPGTRRNERREAHEQRVAYANEQFGRDGTRPGARSDRGRMYVLFGEPQDRRQIHSSAIGLYPTEVWFYQAPKDLGLPPFFYLVFFKAGGVGDYRLYSPVKDGPEALIGGGAFHLTRSRILELLKDVDRDLYRSSLSLDPGASSGSAEGGAGIGSDLLLAKVESLPNRAVDTRYLSRMVPRGEVQATVSYESFPLQVVTRAGLDPDGSTWLHYEVRVPPQALALEENGTTMVSALELLGVLTDEAGRDVRRIIEEFTIELSPQQAEAAGVNPLALAGRAVLAPGAYNASLMVRNPRTGTFGSVTARVVVPEPGQSLRPGLLGLFLAGHGEPVAHATAEGPLPFEVSGLRLFPLHFPEIAAGERPWLAGQVLYPVGAGQPAKLVKTLSVSKGTEEVFGYMGFLEPRPAYDGGAIPLAEELRTGDGGPGDYTVVVKLKSAAGEPLDEWRAPFTVLAEGARRPWVLSREGSREGVQRELARQLMVRGERAAALRALDLAVSADPSRDERLEVAAVLLALEEPTRALAVLKPVLEAGAPVSPIAYLYAGAGHALAGQPGPAATAYEKALAATGPEPLILNALADAYAKLKRTDEARRAFERSLELVPDQPQVVKALQALGS